MTKLLIDKPILVSFYVLHSSLDIRYLSRPEKQLSLVGIHRVLMRAILISLYPKR